MVDGQFIRAVVEANIDTADGSRVRQKWADELILQFGQRVNPLASVEASDKTLPVSDALLEALSQATDKDNKKRSSDALFMLLEHGSPLNEKEFVGALKLIVDGCKVLSQAKRDHVVIELLRHVVRTDTGGRHRQALEKCKPLFDKAISADFIRVEQRGLSW